MAQLEARPAARLEKFTSSGDRNFDDLADKFAANIYGTRKGRLRLDIVVDDVERELGLRFPERRGGDQAKSAGENSDDQAISAGENSDNGVVGKATLYPFDPLAASAAAGPTPGPERRLIVLDAGGGLGQFSAALAAMGHSVVLCDVSTVMLERAKRTFEAACGPGLGGAVFVQCAAQDLLVHRDARAALGLPPLADCRAAPPGPGPGELPAPGGVTGTVDLVLFHAVVEWMADPLPALQVLETILRPGGHLSCLFYNK